MSQSKITLIGLYNHFNLNNEDLFLHMSLPTGIDKETVINNILMRGGEFEVLYANPYFLRDSMVTWSKKWNWTFEKWLGVINAKYNPVENYDRYEESAENQKDVGSNTSSRSDTRTDNLKEISSGSDGGTVTNTRSAFDSSDYSPHDKTETSSENENTVSNTGTQSQTGVLNGSNENTMDKSYNAHIHGNIGIRSSQELATQEIELAMFNLYDKIADIFIQEYCLLIY